MEIELLLIIFAEILAVLFVAWAILNEKLLIEFEKNFPQNVKNYILWHIRWLKKKIFKFRKVSVKNGN